MRLLLQLLLILAVVAGALFFLYRPQASTEAQNSFRFEIVDTDEARELGLGGRTDIPENYGMLFVFPEASSYGFWMKDMETSIDILWLKDDGTILGIEEAVSPDTYPEAFYPPEPVRYVLETRAGEATRQAWGVGTVIDLPL